MNWVAAVYWVLGVGMPFVLLACALVVVWWRHPAPSSPPTVVLPTQKPVSEWKYREVLLHLQAMCALIDLDPESVSTAAIVARLQQAQQAYISVNEATIAQQLQELIAREADRIRKEVLQEEQLLAEMDVGLQMREQPRYGSGIPSSSMLPRRTSVALHQVERVW